MYGKSFADVSGNKVKATEKHCKLSVASKCSLHVFANVSKFGNMKEVSKTF